MSEQLRLWHAYTGVNQSIAYIPVASIKEAIDHARSISDKNKTRLRYFTGGLEALTNGEWDSWMDSCGNDFSDILNDL